MFLLLVAPAAFSQQQQQKPLTFAKNQAVAEANERLMRLALATSVKQSDYVIGAGDVLGIEVFDVPELTRDVRVNQMGDISLPLIPAKVRVAGLTSFQLQDKIEELLQANGLVSHPQVTVSLKEQHSEPIILTGAVRNTMVIQAMRDTTLLQALSQAGGIADDAGTVVNVTRPAPSSPEAGIANSTEGADPVGNTAQTFTINLNDLLESGDPRFNIQVMGGDIIFVPRAGIIYVVGAVTRPGGFLLQNDRDRMTALKMLSLAGGPTGTAKTKNAVILRKNPETGKRDQVPLNVSKLLKLKTDDVFLEASDILYIPDSSRKRAMHTATDVAVGLTAGVALIGMTGGL